MPPSGDDVPPAASEEGAAGKLPMIELETLLSRPPSRRKRLLQLALLLAALMIALAALRSDLLPSNPSASKLAPPQISATLWSNVNFGTLTVNGKKLDKPLPLTMLLPARGTTIITLDAPPFRPHTCRFTNLTAPVDDPVDCQFDYAGTAPTPTPTTGSAPPGGFSVGVLLTPDDLPEDQQRQALAAMSLPLSAPQQTSVHPGEYIATGYRYPAEIISQRATTSLVARATFEPAKMPGLDGGPRCGAGICPWGEHLAQATALHLHAWSLFFTEALRWQISDASGVTRGDVSFPLSDIVGVLLTEDAAAGWQLSALSDILGSVSDTTCRAGIDILRQTMGGAATLLHDAGVEGCALRGVVNGVNVGRYVWRFGVLLAADAQARASQPDLPIAPKAEIAAVGGSRRMA